MVGYLYMTFFYKFPTESNSERILKIGKYLVELWARVRRLVFLTHGVVVLVMTFVSGAIFALVNCQTQNDCRSSTLHSRGSM